MDAFTLLCSVTTNFNVIDHPDKEDELLIILWEDTAGINNPIIQFHLIIGKIVIIFSQF